MHIDLRGLTLITVLLLSTLFSSAQDSTKYEGPHDEEGYRNGWFLDYWNEHLRRVKNPAKAVFTTRALYAHGVKLTLYNTLPAPKRPKRALYKVVNDSLVKLNVNEPNHPAVMLDGKYVLCNKKGKTAASFEFEDGIPIGTFAVMDKRCDYVESLQEFYSIKHWDTIIYKLKDVQLGTGEYYYYYQYKQDNGKWSYCGYVDSTDKKPYKLTVFPDHRPNNLIPLSDIIVNDSILIKMDPRRYCSFYLDNPNVKLRIRYTNTELPFNLEQPQNVLSLHRNLDGHFNYKLLEEELWGQIKMLRKLKLYQDSLGPEECFPIEREKRKKWS